MRCPKDDGCDEQARHLTAKQACELLLEESAKEELLGHSEYPENSRKGQHGEQDQTAVEYHGPEAHEADGECESEGGRREPEVVPQTDSPLARARQEAESDPFHTPDTEDGDQSRS